MALTKDDDTMSVSHMCPHVLATDYYSQKVKDLVKVSSFVFLKVTYSLCLSFGAGMRRLVSRMAFDVARDGPSGAIAWSICKGSGFSVPLALLQPDVEAGVCEP